MILKLIKKLKAPFPIAVNKWPTIISISLTVFIILLIFKPFGLSNANSPVIYLILAGYGFITFIVLVINLFFLEGLFKRFFIDSKWTVIKEIVWILWLIISIGIANVFYTHYFFNYPPMHIKFFILFISYTLVIGIIPVSILILNKQNQQLKKYAKLAGQLNRSLHEFSKESTDTKNIVTIYAENRQNKLVVNAQDIVAITSEGNYATIYYESEEKNNKQIFRNTLHDIDKQCKEIAFLFKCHRAFIINLNKIKKAKGNSQGYKLQLGALEMEIPVSRSYSAEFKKKMKF